MNGLDSILEWHFMSDDWKSTDLYEQDVKIPVKLVVTSVMPAQSGQPASKLSFVNNIFNFRKTDLNLVDFDITACNEQLQSQSLVFGVSGS